MILFLWIFLSFQFIDIVYGSAGDRSKFYQDCVWNCKKQNCSSNAGSTDNSVSAIPGFSLWSCKEDCEYDCQWKTVNSFLDRKWAVPQFNGKWPFIRIFGLQEPASAIFSVFNFLVIVRELSKFRKSVPPDCPYYKMWHVYSAVCLNCWVWSTLFHTRDSDVTERLDYISAAVMVFASFYGMTVRALRLTVTARSFAWSLVCACVVINHCAYLWFFPFDYSYNMIFNVVVGSLAVAGWLLWAAVAIKQGHPCSIRVAGYSVLMAVATLLELFDFPPLWWTFDAHALWHLSTCFIVQIFYSFLREDCLYLKALEKAKLPTHLKKN